MQVLVMFVALNLFNVVIQTVKSIATIKCGKTVAALVNALAYGVYTFVVVGMNDGTMSIYLRAAIVAASNLLGVYVVKWIEEKHQKERLWKIELAVPALSEDERLILKKLYANEGIPCNYVPCGQWTMFNCYCATKEQVKFMRAQAKKNNAKISAYESKIL